MKDYLHQAVEATRLFERKDITVQEWIQRLLGDDYLNMFSDEYCRRAEKVFSAFVDKLEANGIEEVTDEDIMLDIQTAKEELQRERMKLFDEKRELNNEYRNQARDELFAERLERSIKELTPIKIAPCILNNHPETTGVLVVSDLHFDSTYTLYGVYGEIVNQYNKEICKGRMSRLISLIEADDIPIDNLLVVFNGDLLEGILRVGSLVKLTQPVIDSTIEISEYLSNWLVCLQEKIGVPIKVAVVGGNHSILRPLMSKPIDERENLEKIIHKFIELRLGNQPNIMIEPYCDAYFASIQNNNILFLHGEDSDLANTIMYYENFYDVDLDYCVAGHYHRGETKTVGVGNVANKEVIRVPSICGTDTYAKKLRKNARAGATMMLFTENGRDWSKNYCLN